MHKTRYPQRAQLLRALLRSPEDVPSNATKGRTLADAPYNIEGEVTTLYIGAQFSTALVRAISERSKLKWKLN